eukprot:6378038-Amphidinium_carterae.1
MATGLKLVERYMQQVYYLERRELQTQRVVRTSDFEAGQYHITTEQIDWTDEGTSITEHE